MEYNVKIIALNEKESSHIPRALAVKSTNDGVSVKLRQIQLVCAVVRHGLSISAASEALFTSQPGVSKQILQLEEELGAPIFERNGRQLSRLTEFGRGILPYLERIQSSTENVHRVAADLTSPQIGTLSIATTHTQARYVLPSVIEIFRSRYPKIKFNLHQGETEQIADLVVKGVVDFAIATENLEHHAKLVPLPCYLWNRAVIVPYGHALEKTENITLEQLAFYPLITYNVGFNHAYSQVTKVFERKRLEPNVVLTATDAEVIKTYVRYGLGIGLIAKMAYEPGRDNDLVCHNVQHLFLNEITSIGVRRGLILRDYMYDFIHLFAPHLDRSAVNAAVLAGNIHKERQLYRAHIPYLNMHG